MFFIVKPRLFGGGDLGADLGSPADPSEAYSAARPEWYFLFLFQFLKARWLTGIFGHHGELVGALIIPGIVMGLLFAMPILGKWRLGHRFNIGLLCVLIAGAGLLTVQAIREDATKPEYLASVKQARRDADRVKHLARERGIPLAGAVELLRTDPMTQGPKLFAKNCASCHRYDGHNGLGETPKDLQAASDLRGFGSRDWISGWLDPQRIASTNYFGATKFADGKMVKFVKKDAVEFPPGDRQKMVAALSAEAQLPSQANDDRRDATLIEEGRKLLASENARCTECHQFRKKDEDATAPDLTGYGSREWLIGIISNPKHDRFYGRRNDRMPAYGEEGILEPRAIEMIADWLRSSEASSEAIASPK
jgi:ubiquinol-cytochrome c reductase cytochrome b subunit